MSYWNKLELILYNYGQLIGQIIFIIILFLSQAGLI